MAVTRDTIRTPEDGLEVRTRRAPGAGGPRAAKGDELEQLRGRAARADELEGRIREALRTEPFPENRHCLDCFCRGWSAAVLKIRDGIDP